MKELLVQFASYNLWANQQITDAIRELPEATQHQELKSSFPSLFKTVLHVWNAENIWWQRMKLLEPVIPPERDFKGDFNELSQKLLQQDRQWLDWISNAQGYMLEHVFEYRNSKKELFKQPVFQVLLHLFNHATYHRGQLVTMLRQAGVEKIPATDFIVWSRR
jgi:uncharacterized damage-inducible protein DinB